MSGTPSHVAKAILMKLVVTGIVQSVHRTIVTSTPERWTAHVATLIHHTGASAALFACLMMRAKKYASLLFYTLSLVTGVL